VSQVATRLGVIRDNADRGFCQCFGCIIDRGFRGDHIISAASCAKASSCSSDNSRHIPVHKLSHLSKSTVSQLVKELGACAWLVEQAGFQTLIKDSLCTAGSISRKVALYDV
jgi:hypothetical protein